MAEENPINKKATVPVEVEKFRAFTLEWVVVWVLLISVTTLAAVMLIATHYHDPSRLAVLLACIWLILGWYTVRHIHYVVEKRYALAVELHNAGFLDEASALYADIHNSLLTPTLTKWRCCFYRGCIAMRQLDSAKGAESFRRALRYDGGSSRYRKSALVRLHYALCMLGNQEEANAVRIEIKQMSFHPLADFVFDCDCAFCLIKAGKSEDALKQLEPWIDKVDKMEEGNDRDFNLLMAYLLHTAGKTSEAKKYLDNVKRTPKDKFDSYFILYPPLAGILDAAEGEQAAKEPRKSG